MAITSQDQLVAAIAAAVGNGNKPPYVKTALAGAFTAGQFVSLWTAAGQPGAGSAPAATPGAVPTSATAGAIPFTNPGSGNSYLARLFATSSVPGTLVLYDRLVAVGGVILTATGAQTVSSAALTRPSATGTNAELWIEITTTVTGAPGNITASYTNTVPTAGQTTTAVAITTAMIAGVTFQLPLAAGDLGVNAVASTAMTVAASAGICNVVIRRRLAEFPIPAAFLPFPPQDPFWSGIAQIYNSACIEGIFQIGSGTSAPAIPSGSLVIAQG
jgi:hypothetical protein